MSSMGERILLHYLNELEESEMAEYMNFLQIYPLRRGCTKIPAEKLQGAEKDDIAYLMISYYKEDYALEIGRSILHQIHRRDLLDTYEESSLYCFREYRRQRQNRNEGMFSRIESYQKTVQEKEKEKEKPKFRLQELESGRKLSKVKIEDYNRLYTQRLKTRYRLMEDRNSRFGEYVYFRDRYAPLLMIKKHRDMKQREKELTWYGEKHVTMMDQRAASIYESLEEFFDPESDGYVPTTIVIQGPAGIGKTMLTHKIMLEWACGELFQGRFDFAFYINCRDLNQLSQNPSLEDLLLHGLPGFDLPVLEILACTDRVLFVVDGADELDFFADRPLYAPLQEMTMGQVLVDLIEKRFCTGSTVIFTTRPMALNKLNDTLCNPRYAEILGFSGASRKQYFENYFQNTDEATKAFNIVQENEVLFTMCFVPLVCWSLCTSIKQQMERRDNLLLAPRTTAASYMSFVSILVRDHVGTPPLEMLKKICALAKDGVRNGKIFFEARSLPMYGLAVKENQSIFLNNDIFVRFIECHEYFDFTHVSVQDFLTALFYVHTGEEGREPTEEHRKEVTSLLEAYSESQGGKFALTVRFMFGIFQKDRETQLVKNLKWKVSYDVKSDLLKWMSEELKLISGEINTYQMGLLHCLYDLHDEEFVKHALGHLKCLHLGAALGRPVSALDFRILLFCLKNLPELEEFRISSYKMRAEDSMALQPSLLKCSTLKVNACSLTDACYEMFAQVLRQSSFLKVLDLSHTPLSASGMKHLCCALRSHCCQLQSLMLNETTLTDASVEDLCSAVKANHSLRSLSLKSNLFSERAITSIEQLQQACKQLVHLDN
ncbi:NACHT, LRR and PYD domains-containing protein 3-like isoform X2 [Ambystoma mexicanum]|uniref:NACHT, LRR and PYD domains-containing protein 3-like isoform X2 n=1 Tax=Ambystoma mexicanum TaxID=8296 RepID=UPI0037E9381C